MVMMKDRIEKIGKVIQTGVTNTLDGLEILAYMVMGLSILALIILSVSWKVSLIIMILLISLGIGWAVKE
jgi:hypothetical protein